MYLSYADYQAYGGTVDETTFGNLEFEAASIIDWYTFGRLKAMAYSDLDEAVKRCDNALIGFIQQRQMAMALGKNEESSSSSSTGAMVASQSNDGVSISYNVMSASEAAKSIKDEMRETVQRYLQFVVDSLGRKVLYRGVYPNE